MKVHPAPITSDVQSSPQPVDGARVPVRERAVRLRLSGITRRYGTVEAVRGGDLAVREGELVALLGPSGCGKTTTLRLIAGFESPDAGSIEIAGQPVADERRVTPPEKRRVGMVFQDYALFPHLSVGQNVAFGIAREPDRRQRVADALAQVGLAGLADRMPHQLSGGQQQRVALARALAPRPDLILLDEPFSNLDPHLRAQVREEVRDILRLAGATAVLVTHDQEEALSLADRVAVMFDGQIAQIAAPETIYHRPVNRAVAGFIGEAFFVRGHAQGDRAETALGSLPLANDIAGPVDVLIRPEMVRVSPAEQRAGAPAVVLNRRFVGRDLLLGIELAQGQSILARVDNQERHLPGDAVRVSVRGAVMGFPAAS
jgi:iron(III) transport system ATP-binding protein